MRIPKKMLDILLRNPEVKTRGRQRKTINKFNQQISIGSAVWLAVGGRLHIIHVLDGGSKYEVFKDGREAEGFWYKQLTILDDKYRKRIEELDKKFVSTKIPRPGHWWGYVGFTVDGRLVDVFWDRDGSEQCKCPNCGKPFKVYALSDIPGVEEHIAIWLFDPGRDFNDKFGEGGARGIDCVCNPNKYMKMKSIAIFDKRLLNAAGKAREKFWKGIEKRFGKNKFERDKYLESNECGEDRQRVVDQLFLRFKGEPYSRRGR